MIKQSFASINFKMLTYYITNTISSARADIVVSLKIIIVTKVIYLFIVIPTILKNMCFLNEAVR